MIKDLMKAASELDKNGFHVEADLMDKIMQKIAQKMSEEEVDDEEEDYMDSELPGEEEESEEQDGSFSFVNKDPKGANVEEEEEVDEEEEEEEEGDSEHSIEECLSYCESFSKEDKLELVKCLLDSLG